jgi:hypothetical protein
MRIGHPKEELWVGQVYYRYLDENKSSMHDKKVSGALKEKQHIILINACDFFFFTLLIRNCMHNNNNNSNK